MPRTFIILILLLGTILIGLFYLNPQWQRFQTLRSDNNELQQLNSEVDALISNLNTLGTTITNIPKENLQLLADALPQGAHGAEFLVVLERLATKNSLALRQTTIEGSDTSSAPSSNGTANQPRPSGTTAKSTPLGNTNELAINLHLNGSYDGFKNFMKDLEKLVRITNINALSFSAPQKVGDSMDINMKVTTYYQ